jgi:ppGpp synthetase/RelA/SpoT-type nucleotidyltranferase
LDLLKNELIWTEQNYRNFGVPLGESLTYERFLECVHPDDREYVNSEWVAALKGKPYYIEHRIIANNVIKWVTEKAELEFDENGTAIKAIGFIQDITDRKQTETSLKKIEWLLEKEDLTEKDEYIPEYGDVTELNTAKTIKDLVGYKILHMLSKDIMDLLDTSVAVYEKNGDYAFGMFVSDWCQIMDDASRKLCETKNNKVALTCEKWLCHENSWNDSAKAAIKTGKSTDIDCVGGIKLHAEPIFAGKEIIGAINIGYGNPPDDETELLRLANEYNIDMQKLKTAAKEYKDRPPFVVEVAKRRLKSIAAMIGNLVLRKKVEAKLESRMKELEIFNDAAVGRELIINDLRKEINDLLCKNGLKEKYKVIERHEVEI